MKRTLIPALLFLPISLLAVEPEEVIEDFFDNLDAGSYSRAIDYFFTGNKRMTPGHLETMKRNLDGHLGTLGQCFGEDRIKKEFHTDYFRTYTYLVRYEKELVFVQLLFYKPKDRWVGYNLVVHGDEKQILEYMYRLKIAGG